MAKKSDPKMAEAEMLRVGLKPLEPYTNSHHKWKTICVTCGLENEKPLRSVRKNGFGCVFCVGKKVHPDLASAMMLKKGFEVLVPFSKSSSPWKSKCLTCGNIVEPTYKYVITQDGSGCKHCSHTYVDPKDAIALMMNHGLEPLEPYKNTMTPWKCRCLKCGEISTPMHSVVRYRNGGCKYCSGNSIKPEYAERVMRSAGYEPIEPYVSNKTKWKSIHIQCGYVVSPKFNNISSGGGGCRNCSTIGYEVTKPAFLYVMQNLELDSLKVGIGNEDSNPNRIKVHEKHGWTLLHIFRFESGWTALKLETNFFSWLRKTKMVQPHLTIEQTPQSGWSETMSATLITPSEIIKTLTNFEIALRE